MLLSFDQLLAKARDTQSPFSRWSGKNAGAMRGVHAGTFRAKGQDRYGTIEMKIRAKFAGSMGPGTTRAFCYSAEREPSRIKDFGLTLGEGKSV